MSGPATLMKLAKVQQLRSLHDLVEAANLAGSARI